MDILTSKERERLRALVDQDAFIREAVRAVERIVGSGRFSRVQARGKDLLRWLVVKALLGEADQIKETTIAIAVFGEAADFNPAETGKVRQAAGDLRQRLADYANSEGQGDIVQILLPLNTYVPEIEDRRTAVVITEFENWHPHGQQPYLCAAITAEITYQLSEAGLRAGVAEAFHIGASHRQLTLRGSVENRKDVLRINVSLADPTEGEILFSQSFEGDREDVLRMTAAATNALLEVIAQANRKTTRVAVVARKHR